MLRRSTIASMDNELKFVQNIELEILKVIDAFCREKEIKYFLSSGTLLGAVRHNGFIPWDDDIDIMLMRKDYERLISELPDFLPAYMELIHYSKRNAEADQNLLIKIIDKRYPCIRKSYTDINTFVWVDVFALDFIPDDPFKRKIFSIHLKLLTKIRSFKRWELYSKEYNFKSRMKKMLVSINRILKLSKLIKLQKLLEMQDNVLKKYQEKKCSDVINYMGEYKFREVFPYEWLGQGIDIQFETNEFSVPEYADKYLSKLYGDYMQLPPKEERVCKHGVTFVNSQ